MDPHSSQNPLMLPGYGGGARQPIPPLKPALGAAVPGKVSVPRSILGEIPQNHVVQKNLQPQNVGPKKKLQVTNK